MTSGIRSSKLVEFFDAAYDFDSPDPVWVARVMESIRAVWKRGVAVHGGLYDANDIFDVRWSTIHIDGFSPKAVEEIMKGRDLISPRMAARNFRHYVVKMNEAALPEMQSMNEALVAFGFRNTMYLNALDPEHVGMLVAVWCREKGVPPRGELTTFARMTHHLAAAYRCRRRLRAAQPGRSSINATEGAVAILDTRGRVVHAEGAARAKDEQKRLVDSAADRDFARTNRPEVTERLARWRPLTSAEWTLVETYERSGTRYIVARENQSQVRGIAMLSGRERQAVAYVAAGQSTKETAYALGISASTVRVLLARAATKLRAKTRAALLDHPEVRKLLV